MAQISFVSGHRDITQEEFDEHYAPLLDKAIENGNMFVVGDCEGVDDMAQRYIESHGVSYNNLMVFHMYTDPRYCVEDCLTHGGYHSDVDRDWAMTVVSDEDIAWVRKGKERSGTAQNLARRKLKADGVKTIQEVMTIEAGMFL